MRVLVALALWLTGCATAAPIARVDAWPRADVGRATMVPLRRLSGVWFDGAVAAESASTLLFNPASGRMRVELHANSAVREGIARAPDAHGEYALDLRVDPVRQDTASGGWVSVTFSSLAESRGWVNDPDSAPGVLVRSSGAVEVSYRGCGVPVQWPLGAMPAPAASYEMHLRLRMEPTAAGPALRLYGSSNGLPFTATLTTGDASALPARLYVGFGAHFHSGDVAESWVEWG
jgi:hypothetical protein